jgi:hypothetical protein
VVFNEVKFRRAYLSNGLEFLSEIKSGVLSDENSILLSNNIYYKRETLKFFLDKIKKCIFLPKIIESKNYWCLQKVLPKSFPMNGQVSMF